MYTMFLVQTCVQKTSNWELQIEFWVRTLKNLGPKLPIGSLGPSLNLEFFRRFPDFDDEKLQKSKTSSLEKVFGTLPKGEKIGDQIDPTKSKNTGKIQFLEIFGWTKSRIWQTPTPISQILV